MLKNMNTIIDKRGQKGTKERTAGLENRMEKGKIIIVEDEENILTMLTEFLTANGYNVDALY